MKILNSVVLFSILLPGMLMVANPPMPITIMLPGDTAPTTGGVTGDLRWALNYINQNFNASGYTVSFDLGGFNTINYGGEMPILGLGSTSFLTIDGTNGGTQIILNGGGLYRGFFAELGLNTTLQNLTFENCAAQGGLGGMGGGGGLGAGAVLFIDQAQVTIANVTLSNNSAVGGAGSAGGSNVNGGGGGGGMGGAGGTTTNSGGGGIRGPGGSGGPNGAGNGGGGGGGFGVGIIFPFNGYSGVGGAQGASGEGGLAVGTGVMSGGAGMGTGAGAGGANAGGGGGGGGGGSLWFRGRRRIRRNEWKLWWQWRIWRRRRKRRKYRQRCPA